MANTIDIANPGESADELQVALLNAIGGGQEGMVLTMVNGVPTWVMPSALTGTNGLVIPYYLNPNSPYSDTDVQRLLGLMRQYHKVPVIVVVNPASGPGTAVDPNYADFIKLLHGAGGKVCGYVATGYGTRPEADVMADIGLWLSLYGAVDGIFLDEQPWETGAGGVGTEYISLYQRYTDHCHSNGLHPVVANPGTNQQEPWFAGATADIIIVHEDLVYPIEGSMEGNYAGGHADYSYTCRAALVYGQPTLDTVELTSLCRYVQWVYVTDDELSGEGALNPWDALPSYLDQLFTAISGST